MSEFTVRGRFKDRGAWDSFERRLEATNENVAIEHVYATFGSKHGLRRSQVEISEVEEQ